MPVQTQLLYPISTLTWGEAEITAVTDCLARRQTTMGDKVAEFEKLFARYVGSLYAIMVNSGASANLITIWAARELGMLKVGSEIIVPAVTWPTQLSSIIQAGFKPVLVDVNPKTLQVEPEDIEAAITPDTEAISLVHLMGNPGQMEAILKIATDCHLMVFEDCCEALGATYDGQVVGSFGVAGAFSFFQNHHITTMEGGMITTDWPEFANMCRAIRAHGWSRDQEGTEPKSRFHFIEMGFNFRPLELEAAFGLVQIQKLHGFNRARKENFDRVKLGLTKLQLPESYELAKPSWFAIPIVLPEGYSRSSVVHLLEDNGIETRPMVGGNLARQPAFAGITKQSLPGADAIHERGFYIGCPPVPTDMSPVIEVLNSI